MIIKSKSFENNGMIPKKHTGFGEDISPELMLNDIPDDTVSLAIVMDDLDVPFRDSFTHWIIWNIPKAEIIQEGLPGGEKIEKPFSAVQGIAWGKHIYNIGERRNIFAKRTPEC
ncbi:MAG: YbhB/YbcL family Raf kinase inhibitor-like protein [Eubacteriales bacterium]|nr:YbhB/YbcL family Raf kinase inhibitor-like protein [Eubacteriales bacterium]